MTAVRLRRDEGMTLIELMVALVIMSIVLSAVAVAFTTTIRSSRIAQERNRISNELRVAVETIGKDVRGAIRLPVGSQPAITAAESDYLGFTTYTDSLTEPLLIQVRFLGGEIIQRRITADPPFYTFAGTAKVQRIFTEHLLTDGSAKFQYFQTGAGGTLIELLPVWPNPDLVADELEKIAIVRVTLRAFPPSSPPGAEPIEVRGEFRVVNNNLEWGE